MAGKRTEVEKRVVYALFQRETPAKGKPSRYVTNRLGQLNLVQYDLYRRFSLQLV